MKRFALLILASAIGLLCLIYGRGFAGNEKATIKIKGLEHSCCAQEVSKELKSIEGVKSAKVSLEEAAVVIEFDAEKTNIQALETAIANLGFDADQTKAKNPHKCQEQKKMENKSDAKGKCGGCPNANSCGGK
jgi:mercuric ion binding protein